MTGPGSRVRTSATTSAFVSHTSLDQAFCQQWILPAIKRAVHDPFFLDYDTFKDPTFRESYARTILSRLRSAEHLVLVLSAAAMHSVWVRAEACWWVTRRGLKDITVVTTDSSRAVGVHPDLVGATTIGFSRFRWLASRALTRHMRTALFDSGWYILKHGPNGYHRSMRKR